jgi:hypothetical protein
MHLNNYIAELRLNRIKGRARACSKRTAKATLHYRQKPGASANAHEEMGNNPAGIERRRSDRLPLEREIILRRVGGFNFDVGIRNISVGGCTVEAIEEYEVGDPVIARFPQLEPLGSRVCWTKGTTAGIQFLRTIHPAVLDSLVDRMA